ncbi:MAG: YfcE family phosphodiesterase [Methanobacteriaceae archaeon]|nr:YfcE family phosphodiesterase [Methanobacteriaceae archaeon]
MLIGVISDTHIPYRAKNIPDEVFDIFKDVELIIHAGDIETKEVINKLEEIAPVVAVLGNMDNLNLNESEVIKINEISIGIIHGNIYPRGDTQQLCYIAKELGVKILISGHTHQAMISEVDDILLLNPGSPTVPRLCDPSVMLINIVDDSITAEIIPIGFCKCKSIDFARKHLK